MNYNDYIFYKPTIWDKIFIEGSGYLFLIMLLAGIWINEFRWRLIFTSLILISYSIIAVLVMDIKEQKLKEKNNAKEQ